MADGKINDTKLVRLVDEGVTQAKIAESFGVTRQAVCKRLRELRGRTTRVTVTKKVGDMVDRKIDAMDQLQKINQDCNELLDLCMRWSRGDEEALQVLESQVRTKKVRVGDEEIEVQEFKFKDPREFALKAMSEIRGQLNLQLDIFQCLFDLRAVQEFQEEVLKAIAEESPDVRCRIIHRLNKKRVVRAAIEFH